MSITFRSLLIFILLPSVQLLANDNLGNWSEPESLNHLEKSGALRLREPEIANLKSGEWIIGWLESTLDANTQSAHLYVIENSYPIRSSKIDFSFRPATHMKMAALSGIGASVILPGPDIGSKSYLNHLISLPDIAIETGPIACINPSSVATERMIIRKLKSNKRGDQVGLFHANIGEYWIPFLAHYSERLDKWFGPHFIDAEMSAFETNTPQADVAMNNAGTVIYGWASHNSMAPYATSLNVIQGSVYGQVWDSKHVIQTSEQAGILITESDYLTINNDESGVWLILWRAHAKIDGSIIKQNDDRQLDDTLKALQRGRGSEIDGIDDIIRPEAEYSANANIWYSRSADNGETWSEGMILGGFRPQGEAFPTVIAGTHGNWLAAWHATKSDGMLADQILCSFSMDAGETWSEPNSIRMKLNEGERATFGPPKIGTNMEGRWVIVWEAQIVDDEQSSTNVMYSWCDR